MRLQKVTVEPYPCEKCGERGPMVLYRAVYHYPTQQHLSRPVCAHCAQVMQEAHQPNEPTRLAAEEQ